MGYIALKFRSVCGSCGVKMAQGSRAWWDKGYKPLCPSCKSAGKTSVPTKPKPEVPAAVTSDSTGRKIHPDFTVKFGDAKRFLLQVLSGKRDGISARNFNGADSALDGGSWSGFTRGQLGEWLNNGYETEAIQDLDGLVPPIRSKRRMRYVEDGDELLIDRVLSGEDNFMATWTKRDVIPGVRLNIELDASASSSEALMAYQRWIAQTIYALEMAGVDCEVEIFTLSRGLFREQRGIARTSVRVKEEGEVADFMGISAMFSPAAFRGVMFALMNLQAEKQGMTRIGYGSGVDNPWQVKYNPDRQSIDVSCSWHSPGFPAEKMTKEIREAIEEMRKGIGN